MYWNNKKIKIKEISKKKTTEYNKLNKKNKPQISIIFASICSYSLLFAYIHLFSLLSKKMQENEQDHPIQMQEKQARPPHTNAREKKTNGPPTRTLKIYAIPFTRIPRGT